MEVRRAIGRFLQQSRRGIDIMVAWTRVVSMGIESSEHYVDITAGSLIIFVPITCWHIRTMHQCEPPEDRHVSYSTLSTTFLMLIVE